MARPKKSAAADAEIVSLEENMGAAPAAPASIRLLAPHGFIDDAGEHQYWHQGQQVEDPEVVKLLIERGASWEA